MSNVGVGVAELRCVGSAESFSSKLQAKFFRKPDLAEEGGIDVEEAGACEHVAAQAAENARSRGLAENRRIKPGLGIHPVQSLEGTADVRCLGVARGVQVLAAGIEEEGRTGHEREDAGHLPSAQDLRGSTACEPVLTFAEGQLIDVALDEGVGTIETGSRVTPARVDVPGEPAIFVGDAERLAVG